ncbi:MAG: fliE [Paucimonas sp.]|jgi:flagellar hook-basal body complex protein FliE|nr:fliE [Paucimonas sp.]
MSVGGIDASRIQAMVEQLRAAAQSKGTGGIQADKAAEKPDFAQALKSTLDQVNNNQAKAQKLGEQFAKGDDNVNLSDVMISMQKASISFQATVQVRNKLVSAYHDIMTMQV